MKRRAVLVSFLVGVSACSTPAAETPAAPVAKVQSLPHAPPHVGPLRFTSGYSTVGAALPSAVTSFGAAALGQQLFVLGGYSGVPHAYAKDGQHGELWMYSQANEQWTELPGVEPLQSATLSAHADTLVRIGGMRAKNAQGADEDLHSLSEVARFTPATQAWMAMNPLPDGRSSHDTVSANGRLFVVGGWRLSGSKSDHTWHDSMLVCEPQSDADCKWKSIQTPFKKRALAAAYADGHVYAIGGMSEDGVSDSVFAYDTAAGTWTEVAPFPGDPFGMAATSLGSQVIASGRDGAVYRYDRQANRWSSFASLSFPRMFHRMVSFEGGAFVVGGIGGMSPSARLRHIERLTLQPERLGTVWTLPNPGKTKNRQGMLLNAGSLYLFGGNSSLEQHDFERERFLAEGYRLNLFQLQWDSFNPFPRQRQSMTSLELDDERALSFGGFGWGKRDLVTSSEGFAYHYDKDEWSELGPVMPESRTQFGYAKHAGELWVFGGMDFDNSRKGQDRFRLPTAVLRGTLDSGGLTLADSGVQLRTPRRAFASAHIGDEFFIFGGMREGFKRVPTCEAFSFSKQRFREVQCPRADRIGAETVVIAGRLYLIAGSSAGKGDELADDQSIEVYDPETDGWSVLIERLPLDTVKHVRAFALNERILLFSTQREPAVAKLVLIDPKSAVAGGEGWAKVDLAPGWALANRAGR